MCRLFKTQDPAAYTSETRAIRLHGHATSIRLEASFWDILTEIAEREGLTLARFCAVLHDEVTHEQGEVANFASLLRVTCVHYMRHKELYLSQLAGEKKALLS